MVTIPLTFNNDLQNLTEQTLVIELEGSTVGGTNSVIDVRTILNVSALDQTARFGLSGSSEVRIFEIPVIRLRHKNTLKLYIEPQKKSKNPPAFLLHRLELYLRE